MTEFNSKLSRILKKLFHTDFLKILIFILFVFLINYVKDSLKKDQPKPRDLTRNMSSLNSGSSGLKAFRTLLDKSGISTVSVTEELPISVNIKTLNHITGDKFNGESVLIIASDKIEKRLSERVFKMAESGFTVIVITDNIVAVKNLLGDDIKYSIKKDKTPDRVVILSDDTNLFRETEYFVSSSDLRVSDYSYNRIASDKSGDFIVEQPVGNGNLVLFLLPDIVFNENIAKSDNMHSLYQIIKYYYDYETVYFYEYIHGFVKRYTVFYLFANRRFRPFVISALLLLAGLFLKNSLRFGVVKEKSFSENNIRYFSELSANLIGKQRFSDNIREMLKKSTILLLGYEKADEIFREEKKIDSLRNKIINELEKR
jgi:hypothetical protein